MTPAQVLAVVTLAAAAVVWVAVKAAPPVARSARRVTYLVWTAATTPRPAVFEPRQPPKQAPLRVPRTRPPGTFRPDLLIFPTGEEMAL